MDQFFSKIFDKVKVTKPGVIGGIIFFVVGILLCIFGFWKTLFICLFTVAGFLFGTFFERVCQYREGIVLCFIVSVKGIKSFVGAFQYQANHLFCRGWKTFITNSDKCNTLTISNVVIWGVMPCIDFEL